MEPMKQSLHAAFSQFGPIVDIIMRKSYRLRGQAFIIFQEIESAAKALRTMQGMLFYDKPLNIRYSKTESDLITKNRGTFVQRPPKPKLEIKPPRGKAPSNGKTGLVDAVDQEPNRILFLTNLPEEANEAMLNFLFKRFPGFKEARLVPGRSDIAFIEFETEYQSGVAKDTLNGCELSSTHKLQILYAKK